MRHYGHAGGICCSFGDHAGAASFGRARAVLARTVDRSHTDCELRPVVRTLLSTLAAAHHTFAAAFLVNATRHVPGDRGEPADGRAQCERAADQPRRRADALRLR